MSTSAISDQLVLAAVERAELHRASDRHEVPVWAILEHLGFARRSGAARRVRAQLQQLAEIGALDYSRLHGVPAWGLTRTGRQRLKRARRAGKVPELPESPQHQAWRNARARAAQEIERFRVELGETVLQVSSLLREDPAPGSDVWFELDVELRHACWRLGSATYCLHEWPEPDDAQADLEDYHVDSEVGPDERLRRYRRQGRRNTGLWAHRGGG